MIRNYCPRACLACLGVAKRARAAVAVAAGGRRWPPVGGQPKLIEGMAYSLRTNNENITSGPATIFFKTSNRASFRGRANTAEPHPVRGSLGLVAMS